MPMLDREAQKQLLGVTDRQCPTCLAWIHRGYCRQCDAFYYECDCNRAHSQAPHEHLQHRTY
jgi:hypothetical protein